MPYDLTGRGVRPLSELITLAEFPLAEFIPADTLASTFDGLFYAEAHASLHDGNLVIDTWLAFETELSLRLPGTDAIALVLASAGVGWTAIHAELVLGPDFSLTLHEVTLGLRVSPDILKDVQTGQPSEIEISADVRFDLSGVTISNYTGASLDPAYLCGTQVIVEAQDVRPVFGPVDPPPFLGDEDFHGLTFEKLVVTFPPEYLQTDPGQSLTFEIANAAIGTTGFTGKVTVASTDLANPVTGSILGFPFRFRYFNLDIAQNAFIDLSLGVDVRLEAFEEGATQKWIAVDFAFGADGSFSGALAAAQPTEASATPGVLVEVEYINVVRLRIAGIRVTKVGPVWAIYFSGSLEVLIQGAVDWPEIAFDEIGVDSNGKFLLPDGAGITFASPMIVNWHFVRLTITKFRFGYANEVGDRLRLALSAELMILEGLPAGASVDGLIVEWTPGDNAQPDVSMTGVGITFGVPGSFNASIALSYIESGGAIEFRGKGALELTSLDMAIEIGIIVGYQNVNLPAYPQAFPYLYLLADAKLMPTGIPIGNTGLSIYGFSGLLAYNMALTVNQTLPPDERYYELFTRPPIGLTDTSKWVRMRGQNALGVGVLLGTADKGYCLNVKGMLIVAFPDLTIFLQAKANFLKRKPDLSTAQEGTLDALFVYASGQSTLSLDILAHWGMPDLISVDVRARAFFSFADPNAWYLEMGQDVDGKRATAQALRWNGEWLFTAGFWFRLDRHGVVTGVQIELELGARKGGFHVSVYGFARGEMRLFWEPAQWEGSLAMSGRISAGYKRWSVGISLSGNARARVRRPFDVYVHVEACIDLWLDKICKSFNFEWERTDPPTLESPIRKFAAMPRHWTPYEEIVGGQSQLNTGVVALTPGSTPNIQPHSVLAVDFAKTIVDSTAAFNEAVSLPDNGFITIGSRSGWSAQYRVDAVTVVRDPTGAAEVAPIWGTWARETLEPNTTLRLLSSERFSDDGSLSNGYVEGADLDYCDKPKDTVVCIPIKGLEPGYGRLDDGPLYHWDVVDDRSGKDGTDDGVVLGPDDTLTVEFPAPTKEVVVITTPPGDRPSEDKPDDRVPWPLSRLCRIPLCRLIVIAAVLMVIVILLLLVAHQSLSPIALTLALIATLLALLVVLVVWLCRCRRRRPVEDGRKPPGKPESDRPPAGQPPRGTGGIGHPGGHVLGSGLPDDVDGGTSVTIPGGGGSGGTIVLTGDNTGGDVVKYICYRPGHGTPDWVEISRRGGSSTPNESWTVPAEQKLFRPNTLYELQVHYTATRRAPDGATSTPLGAPGVVSTRFYTLGPPSRSGALADYITSTYPFDGARPVYTGYDIRVKFHEDYVPHMYTAAGEQLAVRLFDGQGLPVADAAGNPLLLPATEAGMIEHTVTELVWEEIYHANRDRGCVVGPPMTSESENTLVVTPASAGVGVLTRNSQYVAQLVSDTRPDVALSTWGFTTSSYETFTELVTREQRIAPAHTVAGAIAGVEFDTVARATGLPTIAYVDRFTITPLLTAGGDRCAGLLLEAPEPIDAGSRLTARLANTITTAIPNVDGTRVFLLRSGGGDWALELLALELTWNRDSGPTRPRLTVSGNASPEIITCDIDLRGMQ